MRVASALAALIAVAPVLAACGLQPLYSGGSNALLPQSLAAVDVPAIPGRSGWLVRGALQDKLGVAGSATPQYRLDVRLDDALEALGVLNDDTISRERRILRARYQLIDLTTGEILLDATAGADAGIDVVSSEYATIAAEQTALENLAIEVADRMVTRIALTLRAHNGGNIGGGEDAQ
ncbi:MAG: LPS assembly lipoprotein LptE [Pseudomonadota bacterium]